MWGLRFLWKRKITFPIRHRLSRAGESMKNSLENWHLCYGYGCWRFCSKVIVPVVTIGLFGLTKCCWPSALLHCTFTVQTALVNWCLWIKHTTQYTSEKIWLAFDMYLLCQVRQPAWMENLNLEVSVVCFFTSRCVSLLWGHSWVTADRLDVASTMHNVSF